MATRWPSDVSAYPGIDLRCRTHRAAMPWHSEVPARAPCTRSVPCLRDTNESQALKSQASPRFRGALASVALQKAAPASGDTSVKGRAHLSQWYSASSSSRATARSCSAILSVLAASLPSPSASFLLRCCHGDTIKAPERLFVLFEVLGMLVEAQLHSTTAVHVLFKLRNQRALAELTTSNGTWPPR